MFITKVVLAEPNVTSTATKVKAIVNTFFVHKPSPVAGLAHCLWLRSGPTERISSFVDSLLQPIAQKQESYIKDTTHFVNFIENTILPDEVILATLD